MSVREINQHLPIYLCIYKTFIYGCIFCPEGKKVLAPYTAIKYRKSGYLCGNIIYANYASSCEGAQRACKNK